MDFVGDGFAVYGVFHRRILDFKCAVNVVVKVVAARGNDGCYIHGIADTVGIEVGAWHGMRFVKGDAVKGAVDHGVDAEREDVLVVGG